MHRERRQGSGGGGMSWVALANPCDTQKHRCRMINSSASGITGDTADEICAEAAVSSERGSG